MNALFLLANPYIASETRDDALEHVRKNGKCIFLGFAEPKQEINIAELTRKQIQLMGSFAFSTKQFEKAIQLVMLTDKK